MSTMTQTPEPVTPSPVPATPSLPSPPTPASPPTDWRATLPEPLQKHKGLERFKDPGALAQSYLDLETKIGSTVKIPGADAKPEEVAAFRDKLGVPKSPDGYELKAPEGMTFDEKLSGEWRGIFHRLGIPATAAQGLVEAFGQYEQDKLNRDGLAWSEGLKELRNDMGELQFNRGARLAYNLINQYGGPEMIEFLETTRLGDHPVLFKFLSAIGNLTAEDGHIDGRVEGIPMGDDLDRQTRETYQQLAKTPPGAPERAALFAKYESLQKLKNPQPREVTR